MLNFLSSSNQKQVVGIALTPGIGLEVAVLDASKKTVVNYGQKKVEYNFSTREIQNYDHFKSALRELMAEMKIAPKTQAYMVLPNVYFDFTELPPTVSDIEIKTVLLSQAEEFYLFKKEEPVSGWCEVVNLNSTHQKRIAFSSFQKTVVDEIKDTFLEVGLQLVGLESAYGATLRGLHVAGLLDDIFASNSSWTAMIINTNSFTLFNLDGKNLIDYNEVPLAIKSFSQEEAYQAIVSSAAKLLSGHASSHLFIVSQTDDISANALKRLIQFDYDITAIESNKFAKESLLPVSQASDFNEANSLTPAVLGAAVSKSDFHLVFNVLSDDPSLKQEVYFTTMVGGKLVEVTSDVMNKFLVALGGALAVVLLIPFVLQTVFVQNLESQIGSLNNEIGNLDTQIAAFEKVEAPKEEIDMTSIIDSVANQNVTAISFYDSIATDIPKNVWLTRYYNLGGTSVSIKGVAENIVDIYEYYKYLRAVSPQANIVLKQLEVVTSPDGSKSEDQGGIIGGLEIDSDFDRLYSFEISNVDIKTEDLDKKYAPGNENNILNSAPAVGTEKVEIESTENLAPVK